MTPREQAEAAFADAERGIDASLRDALAAAATAGDAAALGLCHAARARASILAGDLATALAAADRAVDVAKRAPDIRDRALACRAEVLLLLDRHEDASRDLGADAPSELLALAAAMDGEHDRARGLAAAAKGWRADVVAAALGLERSVDSTPAAAAWRALVGMLLSRPPPRTRVMELAARVLDGAGDLDAILKRTLELMTRATGAERGFILLIADGAAAVHVSASGMTDAETTDLSSSVIRRVVQQGRAVLVADAGNDEWAKASASIAQLGLRSIVSVPVRHDGRVAGAVYLDRIRSVAPFEPADAELLQSFADRVAPLIVQARRIGTLERAVAIGLVPERHRFGEMVGRSRAMQDVYARLERFAATDQPVMLEGETGTGKELAAVAIHSNSARRAGPFVPINVAALAEGLVESELFGHVRGAFTGADRDRVGLLESASGGTVFLDEIESMPASMQTKLLRVLEEKRVLPVGATVPRPIDVRIVAASNRPLRALVAARQFREDLFYRLSVLTLRMPPLRERVEDLDLLADRFLPSGRRLSADARAILSLCPWPGNVRQFKHELAQACVAASGEIRPEHLTPYLREESAVEVSLEERLKRLERDIILQALHAAKGNIRRAAKLLKMDDATLGRRIQKYGLKVE